MVAVLPDLSRYWYVDDAAFARVEPLAVELLLRVKTTPLLVFAPEVEVMAGGIAGTLAVAWLFEVAVFGNVAGFAGASG